MKEETNPTWKEVHGGYAKDMTLRDYFAAKAMQGDFIGGVHHDNFDIAAKRAYMMADVMIAAREAK